MKLGRKAAAVIAFAIALAPGAASPAGDAGPPWQPTGYRDGHARPRALAFNQADGLLYVALSTRDELAVVDPRPPSPRVLERVPVCRFPAALVALPGGGVLAACRFDAGLRRVTRNGGRWRVDVLAPQASRGGSGLALAPDGRVAYVSVPAAGGVEVVSLDRGEVIQVLPTGLSPRALRVVPADRLPPGRPPLLLVSAFIDHLVSIHPIDRSGRLAPAEQVVRTEAPALDMVVAGKGAGAELWLLTHEDRAVSRANGPVEGLDSGVIRLPVGRDEPFTDPGPGRRSFVNLGERSAPVIELDAAAESDGRVAIVGAGTDNLLVLDTSSGGPGALASMVSVPVGENPSAVAFLADGRVVSANRLSDALSFVDRGRVVATVAVGAPERRTPAELGELLFHSRALVPNNVADGPLSLYTCAACHPDGHIDGRRHPAKRNRFFSMTESCRGLATTAPYLTLGNPETIAAFADNIVATHAQGAERDPHGFATYPVRLQTRDAASNVRERVLSPTEVREALAAYMARIPPEPSPFGSGRQHLTLPERRGLALFRASCTGCHQLVGNSALGNSVSPRELERRLLAGEVALTSPRRYDVGTPVLGEGGNNPPSLRGGWDAAPYFSDGSARTLDDVLRRTDPDATRVHGPENATRPPAFSAYERDDLLAFLRAL